MGILDAGKLCICFNQAHWPTDFMEREHALGDILLRPSEGWLDVTSQLLDANVPYTLARPDGVGVLQFSTAEYLRGKRPDFSLEALSLLLDEFSSSRELRNGFDSECVTGSLLIVSKSFQDGGQFVRVWYCSNGQDVVLITYTCLGEVNPAELNDCETMIRTISFAST